jgi:transposase
VDSAGLALYGLTGRLRPYVLPSDDVDEIKQLVAARRGLSQSRSALKQQQESLPRAAATLAPAIIALSQQIATIDRRLARLAGPAPTRATTAPRPGAGAAAPVTSQTDDALVVAAAPPPTPVLAAARLLRAVPGVGPVTAVALAVCLVEKQFTHPDQFVAYVGLDIRVQQSGRRRGQFGLSKHGDAELRRLLYLAAMSAARSTRDRTFADRYAREQAKGLAKTQALNAVARKLAKVAWSLVTHQATYNPARVHLQLPAPLDTQP